MVNKSKWLPYIFVLPAVVFAIIFMVVPAARAIYLSFFSWRGVGEPTPVGLSNYTEILTDDVFWQALLHTVLFSVLIVITSIVLGILLAIAIDRRVRGWSFYKFVYYIPVMMALTVVSVLWIKILEPNAGILNTFLRSIGLDSMAKTWLGDAHYSLYVIVFVAAWECTGNMMIIFLASLSSIDPAIHEAATLDGATEFKRIFHITLPMIKRPIYTVVMLQIISAFKSFDMFWIMTQGGPGRSSEVLTTMLYREIVNYREYGMACAISVLILIIIGTISIAYIKGARLGQQVIE